MVSVVNGLGKVIDKSTEENLSRCKVDPSACLWQACVDAVVFIALFASMSVMIDHKKPSLDRVVTFAALWIPVNFALAALDLEIRDQLPRVAGWNLALKMTGLLNPV